MRIFQRLVLLSCLMVSGLAAGNSVIPVTIAEVEGKPVLLREGAPFAIKGAGYENGDIASLAAHGANSFRNWGSRHSQDGLKVLDEAVRHGLTVAMCIAIGRERHGFDYDDEAAVAKQFERAKREVMAYKDHPALLLWIIGNEPDLGFTNPRVFDAINDIAKMIKQVDGNHPTTTALTFGSGTEFTELLENRAPDVDIISVQKYADIVNLPRYIEASGIQRPFLVTEWGPVGHWEVDKTAWGAPIEANSSEKAVHYLARYQDTIMAHPERIMGSYAFLWGQKQERTPTWYSMFLPDGSETEVIDAMHYIWNGRWPENRAPGVEALSLNDQSAEDNIVLQAGDAYSARVVAADPDNDALSYHWEIMRESDATQEGGDREEIPEVIPGLENTSDNTANVIAPTEPGAYRLFVYIYDGQGHAGHANVPFLVKESDEL